MYCNFDSQQLRLVFTHKYSKHQLLWFFLSCCLTSFFTFGFFLSSTSAHAKNITSQKSTKWKSGSLLIDLAPALCKSNSNYSKYRQCKDGRAYVIEGFDFKENIICHSKTTPNLPPLQAKMVARIMPDKRNQVQVWQKYGACSNVSSTDYFRQIINHSSKVKLPHEVTSGKSYVINKSSLIEALLNQNIGLKRNSLHLSCRAVHDGQPVLTQIEICFKNGVFSACELNKKNKNSNDCGNQFIILGR